MFELKALPFNKYSVLKILSEETLSFHHGKHQKTYVDNLNSLIKGTEFESMSLEDIIKKSSGSLYNNAAQVWNHEFYWNSINPSSSLQPTTKQFIDKDFGSLEEFKSQFKKVSLSAFGSAWSWLVKNKNTDKLSIETTSNASNFVGKDSTPLFVCDLWEHAYYIDYRNKRADYLDKFLTVINWNFVEENIKK